MGGFRPPKTINLTTPCFLTPNPLKLASSDKVCEDFYKAAEKSE